jgi:hypothetical protein
MKTNTLSAALRRAITLHTAWAGRQGYHTHSSNSFRQQKLMRHLVSSRLAGNGRYTHGRFTVEVNGLTLTIENMSEYLGKHCGAK